MEQYDIPAEPHSPDGEPSDGAPVGADPIACDLTVSIATYDRPQLLARTLRCCVAQTNRRGLRMEVLVTDNHPSGNGRIAVDEVAAETTVPIRYQVEPARNMSTVRNVGLKGARGALIAIIDDDEFCEPDWIDRLLDARERTGGDAILGVRRAIFAAGHPPPYDPQAHMFTRDLHLPQDSVIDLVRKDGRPLYGLGTGNTLLDAARCCGEAEPFDRGFGNAGGEDSEYFMRLFRAGRTLIWAPDAVVTEIVPEHRTDVSYRLLRARRETQIYVSIYLYYASHRSWVWAKLVVKGVLKWLMGAAVAVATFEFGSKTRLRGRLLMVNGGSRLDYKHAVGYIDEPSSGTTGPA